MIYHHPVTYLESLVVVGGLGTTRPDRWGSGVAAKYTNRQVGKKIMVYRGIHKNISKHYDTPPQRRFFKRSIKQRVSTVFLAPITLLK